MRKPDAETYELGHWESMTIQRALTDLAANYKTENPLMSDNENQVQFDRGIAVEELARIFALGTHTVTRKAE
jgi:hypothetical protein